MTKKAGDEFAHAAPYVADVVKETTEWQAAAALTCAIAAVMAEVQTVGKAGKNKTQNYAFTRDPDMVLAVSSVMAKNGLVLVPLRIEPWGDPYDVAYQTSRGGNMWRLTALWTWEVRHCLGGLLQFQTLGSGINAGDKASYSAATGAKKYALEQLFLIARDDAPDPERDLPQGQRPAERQRQQSNSSGHGQPRGNGNGGAQAREPQCPTCRRSAMWANLDNDRGKRNFKCRDRSCAVQIWETDRDGRVNHDFVKLHAEAMGKTQGAQRDQPPPIDDENLPI